MAHPKVDPRAPATPQGSHRGAARRRGPVGARHGVDAFIDRWLAQPLFATLPRDLTERNIRLFAQEVLPALQPLSDKEYAGMQVAAE